MMKKKVNLEIVTTQIWKKKVKIVNFVMVEGLKPFSTSTLLKHTSHRHT
jgi:hypothetical protein